MGGDCRELSFAVRLLSLVGLFSVAIGQQGTMMILLTD